MSDNERTKLVIAATEATCSSIEGLAKCADLSPHSIWSWTSGRRSPSGESVSKLADELDRRSEKLAELAKKLREAAEE
jgi:transcriptional regulator with XRE-family HTH domain